MSRAVCQEVECIHVFDVNDEGEFKVSPQFAFVVEGHRHVYGSDWAGRWRAHHADELKWLGAESRNDPCGEPNYARGEWGHRMRSMAPGPKVLAHVRQAARIITHPENGTMLDLALEVAGWQLKQAQAWSHERARYLAAEHGDKPQLVEWIDSAIARVERQREEYQKLRQFVRNMEALGLIDPPRDD